MESNECVNSMDIDLSEKYIVLAQKNSLVRLFSIKDLDLIPFADLSGHLGSVTKALFVNQGEIIASCDFSGKVILWKLEGSSYSKKLEIQVCDGPIYDMGVRYEVNQIQIFCGCDDGRLRTVAIDEKLKYTINEQTIHTFAITSVSVNDHYILLGGYYTIVTLIDKDGKINELDHHTDQVTAVALSSVKIDNGCLFATCSRDGKLFIFFKNGENIKKQEFIINEKFNMISWGKTGYSLIVSYGDEKFKTFMLNENESFEEVPVEELESK